MKLNGRQERTPRMSQMKAAAVERFNISGQEKRPDKQNCE